MPSEIKNRILFAIVLFIFTISIGIAGYGLLSPGSSTFDAFYMTIITLSTVGYGEVIDLAGNTPARLFTIILILFGMGNLLFVVTTLTSFITDGDLQEILRKRRMLKMIEKLSNHIIVCGHGIICKRIVKELLETQREFVLVSSEQCSVRDIITAHEDILFIEGDPSHDDTLISAGVENANGFIAALPDDKDNLLAIVTAKSLKDNLRIIASATDPETISKFKRIGADVVVSPTLIGGMRIVSEMIRPSVTSFLDIMLRDTSSNTRFENVLVEKNSEISGKLIRNSNIKQKTGLLVLSLRKSSGEFIYNPTPDETLSEGMDIIVIGAVDNIEKLRKLAKSS